MGAEGSVDYDGSSFDLVWVGGALALQVASLHYLSLCLVASTIFDQGHFNC